MDPKDNPTTPTSEGQSPASSPAPTSQEVTVDFTQNAQGGAAGTTQPAGSLNNDMPSISSDPGVAPADPSQAPAGAVGTTGSSSDFSTLGGQAAPYDQSTTGVTPGGEPTAVAQAPLQPQDPYASSTAGVPTTTSAPEATPPAMDQTPFAQPAQNQQPFGQPGDSGADVPPVAPVPAHGADKKTILILAGVAVILIVAILVLVLM